MTRIGTNGTPPPGNTQTQGTGTTSTPAATGTGPAARADAMTSTSEPEPSARTDAGRVSDTFDGTARQGSASPTDQRLAEASDRFTARMEDVLNRDALSLSRGEQPWREGQPLTDAQQGALRDAAKDYLMDVPLGAMAPGVKDGVGALLERAGVRPENLDSMSLRDVQRHVGDAASDYAESLVDRVKDKAPAAYYGILGAGAAAAGGLAYTKGSDALRRLGVKPEMKLGLFHDHIELRAGAEWEARFRNFEPTAGLRARVSGERYALDGDVSFNRHGLTDARLTGHYTFSPRTSLAGSVEYQSLHSLRDPNPNLSLDGAADDRLRASLSLVHRPTDNSSLALSATYDNATGPWVGVGFSMRF